MNIYIESNTTKIWQHIQGYNEAIQRHQTTEGSNSNPEFTVERNK